jgi:hypothetical protein
VSKRVLEGGDAGRAEAGLPACDTGAPPASFMSAARDNIKGAREVGQRGV